jgi:hypothetical protein
MGEWTKAWEKNHPSKVEEKNEEKEAPVEKKASTKKSAPKE